MFHKKGRKKKQQQKKPLKLPETLKRDKDE